MFEDHRVDADGRIAALERYAILDTPTEAAFDDLAELARTICGTPVALVSFVVDDRQWFKAHIGHDGSETPIAQSVCAHAIHEDELLVIPDLTQDDRTRTNTLVTADPFMRFYAGAVLRTPDGIALGTLCVIDMEPRPQGLSEVQKASLKRLARQVMDQLELRRSLGNTRHAYRVEVEARAAETETLRRLLRDAPSFMAVLRGPDHVFELTNDSYLQLVGHRDIVGLPIREALPDIAGQGFFELLDTVYSTGEPFVGRGMAIELQAERDGPVFQAYLNFVFQPILDDRGTVTGIFVEGTDISDQKRAELNIRENELKTRIAMEAARIGVWEATVRDGQLSDLSGDERALELWGGSPERQAVFEEVVSWIEPDDRPGLFAAGSAALDPDGSGILDIEYRVVSSDGRPERWVHARAQRVEGETSATARLVGTVRDISHRKLADARQRLLAGELQHRIKNILAMVTSIGNQTLRGKDIADRRNDFMTRVEALSHAHDILMASSWSAASMREVVEGALRPNGSLERFEIEGPDIMLVSQQAMSLALTVHELATNAIKYGALQTDEGLVSIRWSLDADPDNAQPFVWVWEEHGGPEVTIPTATGFGTKMITRVLAAEFSGTVGIDYAPQGIVCTLVAKAPVKAKPDSRPLSAGEALSLDKPKAGPT